MLILIRVDGSGLVVVLMICVDGGVGAGWRLDVGGVEMGGEEVGGM